jgi:hypothetical protein
MVTKSECYCKSNFLTEHQTTSQIQLASLGLVFLGNGIQDSADAMIPTPLFC